MRTVTAKVTVMRTLPWIAHARRFTSQVATVSSNFPTTANAYDRYFNGGASDAFVTGLSVLSPTR